MTACCDIAAARAAIVVKLSRASDMDGIANRHLVCQSHMMYMERSTLYDGLVVQQVYSLTIVGSVTL